VATLTTSNARLATHFEAAHAQIAQLKNKIATLKNKIKSAWQGVDHHMLSRKLQWSIIGGN
jgi:phage shock protein A